MRSWRALLLLSGLAACHFSVDSVDLGTQRDLAVPRNHDMPGPADLGARGDMQCGGASCMFGCVPGPTPHCRSLAPSGVVTVADYSAAGLTAQTTTGDVTIDTATGAMTGGLTRAAGSGVVGGIGFRIATQVNGPSVGVFGVAGLTLPAGQKIIFTGSNAFALASNGNVTIAGTIDGACKQGVVGPGGSAGGSGLVGGGMGSGLGGGTGGATAPGGASGGGGGGFGDVGGTGAMGMGTMTTAGGVIWPNITGGSSLILVGGSGGGAGGGVTGGAGGGGGGAIQLSINGNLMVSGTIDVSGCGGAHSTAAAGNNGGGGGGSGGAIVLEGAQVALTASAVVSANGGGGGGGGDTSAGDGGDGTPGSAPAMGGAAGGGGGGGGGDGGSRGAQAGVRNTEGQNAPVKGGLKFGGGGGGGTGRILFRGLMVNAQANVISPDFGDFNANNQKMTLTQMATFQ